MLNKILKKSKKEMEKDLSEKEKVLHPPATISSNGEKNKVESSALFLGLNYLQDLLLKRLKHYFDTENNHTFILPHLFQLSESDDSALARFLQERKPTQEEVIMLLTALAPHVYPNFYDAVLARFVPKGRELPEFGGLKGTGYAGTLPSGNTVAFILAGNDLATRLEIQYAFKHSSFLTKESVLWLEQPQGNDPFLNGRLMIDEELAEWFTTGTLSMPKLSSNFPAEHISTELEWEDLVLDPETMSRIKELEHWLENNDTLLYEWQMHKKIKPGYRVLFHGQAGTGKTLTASLLAKSCKKPVFRIDLSMIVSKFIGETEKNLAKLFNKAESKNWILFFDEADALFGKRTSVRDAHDKYANQEVSYLLQRIEGYNGLVILATNFKNNIDDAFTRRFQSIVHFPKPKAPERLKLWQKAFPTQVSFDPDIDFQIIAKDYEVTGSNIINIVQYCCNELLATGSQVMNLKRLKKGIRREYAKENKMF